MTTKTKHIAIIACTLAFAACGAPTETTDASRLGEVSGSTYGQALLPDGTVDCDQLHDALGQYGIDPALLEPETVFQACADSGGVSDDVCHEVAYKCFGDQGCGDDGHTAPGTEDCDQLLALLPEHAADGSELDPSEVCSSLNLDDATCMELYTCVNQTQPPAGEPDNSDSDGNRPGEDETSAVCQGVFGAPDGDPDPMSEAEMTQLCLDQGWDEQFCRELANECLSSESPSGSDNNTDPSAGEVDCQEIEMLLADLGYQTPLDESEAEVIYQECLQRYEVSFCDAAYQCAMNP